MYLYNMAVKEFYFSVSCDYVEHFADAVCITNDKLDTDEYFVSLANSVRH